MKNNNNHHGLRWRQRLGLCIWLLAAGAGAAHAQTAGLRFWPMQLNYAEADSKGGVALNVMNNTSQVFLLKGSVSAMDPDTGRFGREDAPTPPFVVIPPLARLEANGRYAFRVRQAGGTLPQDRESACIVSVTAIPGVSETTRPPLRPGATSHPDVATTPSSSPGQGAELQIALRMNMRLFYRPAGVPERDNDKVASQLVFRAEGKALKVDNPTPYFVHLASASVAGKKIKDETLQGYIAPKSARTFDTGLPVQGTVEWMFSGDKEARHAVISR